MIGGESAYERNRQESSNEKLFLENSIVVRKEDTSSFFSLFFYCACLTHDWFPYTTSIASMCNKYIWGEYSWGPAIAIGVWRPAHPFDGSQASD
jgi:hypothetical protein